MEALQSKIFFNESQHYLLTYLQLLLTGVPWNFIEYPSGCSIVNTKSTTTYLKK